jgi:hypothetical protein
MIDCFELISKTKLVYDSIRTKVYKKNKTAKNKCLEEEKKLTQKKSPDKVVTLYINNVYYIN